MRLLLRIIITVSLICQFDLHSQSALDYQGWLCGASLKSPSFSMTENGGYLFPETVDISISASFGSEFSPVTYNSINYIALSKKLNRHFFQLSYTPGAVREFLFSSSSSLTGADSVNSTLENKITYSEVASFDYGFAVTQNLSAGFTLRYFTESFSNDVLGVVFTSDTLYPFRDNESQNIGLFRFDAGVSYMPRKDIRLSLITGNLFANENGVISETNKNYLLRNERSATLSAIYNYYESQNLHTSVETNGIYSAALNGSSRFFGGNLLYGIGFFGSVSDSKLSGLIPSVSFRSDNWGVTISGIRYLNSRGTSSLSEFTASGISDINFNIYNYDKISAGVYYEISTTSPKYAAITGIKLIKNIYTGLGDTYSSEPFAEAQVYNMSGEVITIRPSAKVEGINESEIYSELVRVNPGDTATVKFYTIVNERLINTAPRISSAEFSVYTVNDKPDDRMNVPLLIYGKNAWDGNVSSLRNFVTADYDFSLEFSRKVLSTYKDQLDTIPAELGNLYRITILYNEVVKLLMYVADPDAVTDRVQYPDETVRLKGGDCDDLSVLFSSLFESIGIETAFIDYKSDSGAAHVSLLVNTGVAADYSGSVSENDKKYYVRKDVSGQETIWLPLETTVLTGFNEAWNTGAVKFYNEAVMQYGLLKNKVEIFEVY